MQSVDDQKLLLLSQTNWLFLASLLGDCNREPLFEVIAAVEDFGKQKVQQGPKLA